MPRWRATISDEDERVRYERYTSDLNVVWCLYEVRASKGTIGYKTRSITILSRVDEHMDVEHKVTGYIPADTMTLRRA